MSGKRPMPRLVVTADRIDYWIRRRVVPCPTHTTVNLATERLVGLTAIGHLSKISTTPFKPPSPAAGDTNRATENGRVIKTGKVRALGVTAPKRCLRFPSRADQARVSRSARRHSSRKKGLRPDSYAR